MTALTMNATHSTAFEIPKVLLIERHLMVADAMIEAMKEFVGAHFTAVQSAEEAIAEINEKGRFSLILVDINSCADIGRLEIERLVHLNGASTVSLIADNELHNKISQLIKLKVCGVILKSMSAASVSNIIRFMLGGEVFFPQSLISNPEHFKNDGNSSITPTDLEILSLLEKGCSNREIAELTGKSEATIKFQLTSLFKKLDAKNRTTAVINAKRLRFTLV